MQDINIFNENEWNILSRELSLTFQQSQVIYNVLTGKSDRQISKEMDLSQSTIRSHLGRLFAKFGVGSKSELIVYIFRHFRTASQANPVLSLPKRKAH